MSIDVQPTFTAAFVEDRSRLTTFFRILMVIPHMFVLWAYSIVAFFTIIAAWFAVVISGQYPEGLYRFHANLLRFAAGLYAYLSLLTDEFPPFGLGGEATDSYPAQLTIGPRKDSYNRALAFFRLIVAIPVMVIGYAMQLVWEVGMFCSWFVIVITGKQIKGLQEFTELGLSYALRAGPYYLLMTEKWPTLMNPNDALPPAPEPTPIASPPVAPAPESSAAPQVPAAPPTPPQPNPFGE